MWGPLRPREALSRQAAGRGRVTRPYPSHEPSIQPGPGPGRCQKRSLPSCRTRPAAERPVKRFAKAGRAPLGAAGGRRAPGFGPCPFGPRRSRRRGRWRAVAAHAAHHGRRFCPAGRGGDHQNDRHGRHMTRTARAVLGRGRRSNTTFESDERQDQLRPSSRRRQTTCEQVALNTSAVSHLHLAGEWGTGKCSRSFDLTSLKRGSKHHQGG